MSYYTYSGLGQITQAAAGYGVIPGGRNVPGIGMGGSQWRRRPGGYSGFGDLIYQGDKVYWRVQDASETVSSIAQKVYGSASQWTKICSYNDSVGIKRDPQTPKGDCWYKVGTMIELPTIPGFPDPKAAAPQSGLATAKAGTTVVLDDGKVATIGEGGKIGKAGLASLSTNMKIGLGVAAAAAVLGIAVLASKKKGAPSSAGHAPQHAVANRRRRHRRH
jgi:hypothetical protein